MAAFACPYCNTVQDVEPDAAAPRAWCAGCGRVVPVRLTGQAPGSARESLASSLEDAVSRAESLLARIRCEAAALQDTRQALRAAVRSRSNIPAAAETPARIVDGGIRLEQDEGAGQAAFGGAMEPPRFPGMPEDAARTGQGAPLCEGHGLSAMLQSLIRFTHSS